MSCGQQRPVHICVCSGGLPGPPPSSLPLWSLVPGGLCSSYANTPPPGGAPSGGGTGGNAAAWPVPPLAPLSNLPNPESGIRLSVKHPDFPPGEFLSVPGVAVRLCKWTSVADLSCNYPFMGLFSRGTVQCLIQCLVKAVMKTATPWAGVVAQQ